MAHGHSSIRAIAKVAAELGICGGSDPSTTIVKWCQANVARYMAEYGECRTADELLAICAQKVGTRFEVITALEELDAVVQMWGARGERQFAALERGFERGVLGITFRLRRPQPWECPFVSVIDARGERKHRAWFTKWHELGHLLILGSGSRASFCRTHEPELIRDPEEALVDRIAGGCAFHPELVKRFFDPAPLTFGRIDEIRSDLCPDASIQSSRIGIVQAWPAPCLLLECRWAPRRGGGTEALRAVKVLRNDAARREAFNIHPNMRVPLRSAIYKSFGKDGVLAGIEDLSWWSASDGSTLPQYTVQVCAVGVSDAVQALVCALHAGAFTTERWSLGSR